MRVLIFKRTHNGDPDQRGRFGVHDCVGAVRKWGFDAVIGIGGISPEARASGIIGKVNWMGTGPRKISVPRKRGPMVTSERFHDFGTDGPEFRTLAPRLAERMYDQNVRCVMDSLSEDEYREAVGILTLFEHARPQLPNNDRIGPLRRSVNRCPTRRCT